MDQKTLKQLLYYDRKTGGFLWRLRDPSVPKNRTWNGKYAGAIAGRVTPRGYIVVYIGGKLWMAHTLAWLYVHGELCADLDHRDRDGTNNKISNLRRATRSQNNHNKKVQSNGTSGYKGVYYVKRDKCWKGHCCVDKQRYWTRACKTAEEAAQEVRALREKLMGEFAFHG